MIKIIVPATSANIGPGFDTLGLALDLYNTFTFEEISQGVELYGFHGGHDYSDNLVYTSMMETFREIGYAPKGIRLGVDGDIPISRGLGSSASCILGGVVGANELAGSPLSKEEVFHLATKIEGHPDNIAPALFGGLVVSVIDGNRILYNTIQVHKGVKFVALVPDFILSTREAREVLPDIISFGDGINNISRVSLLLSALSNGRFDLLRYSLQDALHQPYRGKLIPNFFNIINRCWEIGALGVYLSGAGPTVMCIVEEDDNRFIVEIEKYLVTLESAWDIKELHIDLDGTRIC
ncbi:homoserine kinase [Tissierellaceae bacterium HCP3S3_D8]